jgi:hypothetical protein
MFSGCWEMRMGNRLRAAQVLGIGRTSLYRYLKRDQLELASAGKAAWGCRGRICADLILGAVDAEPG